MEKYIAIAQSDLEAKPHTWTKGLDYEIVEKTNFLTLASNEGQVNYTNTVKEEVLANFKRVE